MKVVTVNYLQPEDVYTEVIAPILSRLIQPSVEHAVSWEVQGSGTVGIILFCAVLSGDPQEVLCFMAPWV